MSDRLRGRAIRMSNPKSAKRGALIAVAAALAAVLTVLAVLHVLRGGGIHGEGRSETAERGTAADDGSLGESRPELEGADASGARSAEKPAPADAATERTGVLRLQFVGAEDGAPAAGLPFLVRQEREGAKELAHGTTDERGRAEVRDLEPNVILVETPRRPPFARKTAACGLARGETKDLVVRLDAGSSVTGRVVDDLKRPVEGAEMLVDSDLGLGSARKPPLEADTVAARTGTDGRFRLDNVADTPSGVWIVDGAERPERWLPATIWARKDAALVSTTADAKPGESLDVGDVVLARLATIAGTVVDSTDQPVEGALVSARQERFRPRRYGATPAPPGDDLDPETGETRADFEGHYELKLAREQSAVAVWTAWGQRQVFDVPTPAPGERKEGVLLKLDAITVLEVELRDAKGERITGPGPAARTPGLVLFARKNVAVPPAHMEIAADLDDGSREQSGSVADSDGIFRIQWEFPASRIRAVSVTMAGYEVFREKIAGGLARGARLTCVLEEMPALRLKLRRPAKVAGDGAAEKDAAETPPVRLWVQACLATPAQRRTSKFYSWKCCGLGAATTFDWKGEDRAITFPAAGGRAFRVYLVGFDRGFVDLADFGPFDPGETVHEIEVDPETLRAQANALTAAAKTPPEESRPGEGAKQGKLSFRLVDSKTGEAIPKGHAHGEPLDAEAKKSPFASARAGEDGHAAEQPFPAGTWAITLGEDGYRDALRPSVLVRAFEATDLGTIALDPMPGWRGRLVDKEGAAAPEGTRVREISRSLDDPDESPMAETDGEGRFVVHGNPSGDPLLEIFEAGSRTSGAGRTAQRLAASGWREDEEKTFTLAPWQRVDVRVGGAIVDPPGASILMWACPAPGEPASICDHRSPVPDRHQPLVGATESAGLSVGGRTFRFRMAPGRYQVFGSGLLHEVPVQEITVKDSPDVQVFELGSQ